MIRFADVQGDDLGSGRHSALDEVAKLSQRFLASRRVGLKLQRVPTAGTKAVLGGGFHQHGNLHNRSSQELTLQVTRSCIVAYRHREPNG